MIIRTLRQAKRTVIVVFSATLLGGGGLLFHFVSPEMSRPIHVSMEVFGTVLLAVGGLLLLSAVPGMPGPRRMLKIVFGFFLLVAGFVMAIPGVPGPGLLTIIGALAILAGEFVWAQKLLHRFKSGAEQIKSVVWKNGRSSDSSARGQQN